MAKRKKTKKTKKAPKISLGTPTVKNQSKAAKARDQKSSVVQRRKENLAYARELDVLLSDDPYKKAATHDSREMKAQKQDTAALKKAVAKARKSKKSSSRRKKPKKVARSISPRYDK